MERGYILSIDQSTQGTKAILLDGQGQFVLRRDLPHRQLISAQGGSVSERRSGDAISRNVEIMR